MSVEIRLLVPAKVAEALRKRAERDKLTIEEVILLAIAKILEEEEGVR